MKQRLIVPALLLLACAVRPQHASARMQMSPVENELAVLRGIEALEAAGDLLSAEKMARTMLAKSPTSLSSLIVLERLLTMQGKIGEIEPYVDKLLAVDPLSVIGHQLRGGLHIVVGNRMTLAD